MKTGRRSGPGQPVGSLAPSSTGEIVAGSERGTVTDIRGVLHDVAGRIRPRWKLKRWPLGRLEFHGGRGAAGRHGSRALQGAFLARQGLIRLTGCTVGVRCRILWPELSSGKRAIEPS